MKAQTHTNKIVWEKWYDPLGEDDLDTLSYQSLTSDDISPTFYSDDGEEIDQDQVDTNQVLYKKPTKIIVTPMGIIPYTENTASSKIFNFWVGHTNFNLTKQISDLIEQIDGIETLDIFTRYRFRIGIGKLFDIKTTINQINDEVNHYLSKREQ